MVGVFNTLFSVLTVWRSKTENTAVTHDDEQTLLPKLPQDVIVTILGLLEDKSKACQTAVLLGIHPDLINREICCLQTLKTNSAIEQGYAELLMLLISIQSDRVKFAQHSLDKACARGFVNILDICTLHKNVQFSPNAMDIASEHGQIGVLQWFLDNRRNRRKLTYSPQSIEKSLLAGRFDVFDWWIQHDLTYKCTPYWIESALKKGYFDAASRWIACSKLPKPKYNVDILHFAAVNARMDILNWYSDSDLELEIYSDTPCSCNSQEVLQWLDQHDLLARCNPDVLIVLMPRAPAIVQRYLKNKTFGQSSFPAAKYWSCRNFDIKTKSSRDGPGCLTFYH